MRSNVNRPSLVRQLSGLLPDSGGALAEAPRQDLAERLAQWLNVADAIQLSSALPSIAALGTRASAQPAPPSASVAALQAELSRVRSLLTQSITARDPRHRPDPNDLDTELALALQRHQDQQRRMAMSVDALRGHVRQVLAKSTPHLVQLAALDALMDQMMGGREQRLLASLPAHLKARFVQRRRQAADAEPTDLGWLSDFHTELEQNLLAELDHRLQAITGLIESLALEA